MDNGYSPYWYDDDDDSWWDDYWYGGYNPYWYGDYYLSDNDCIGPIVGNECIGVS